MMGFLLQMRPFRTLSPETGCRPRDLTVTYSGSLDPGGTVTAAVTVVIPAGNLPGLGFVGELHYTASSTEHVDSYRDSST